MIKEEKSIFRKILKSNVWRWNNKKNKIINFLVGNNYIREWEYTITELFEVK